MHTDIHDLLIVDDAGEDRLLLRRLLRRVLPDVEVREANSIADAIAAIDERLPDQILLDNGLPDGDAITLLDHLTREPGLEGKRLPPVAGKLLTACPCVVLTAAGSEMLAVKLLRAGAGDYLPKSRLALRSDNSADEAAHTLLNSITHARYQHRLARRAAVLRQSAIKKRRKLRDCVPGDTRNHPLRSSKDCKRHSEAATRRPLRM